MEEIFHGGSTHPLKIREILTPEKGRALCLSLFLVPLTWATALVPRHLKTRKGLWPYHSPICSDREIE
jgi:hypothetical protein